VNERTIARRYATALLGLADKAKEVEQAEEALLGLAGAYRASAEFRRALTHPRVSAKDKKDLLRKTVPGLTPLVGEFLDLLIEKNRTTCLPEIADVFDDLADQYAGIVRMTVETAVPMPEAQRARLAGRLSGLAKGRRIELDARVNPDLLGGVRVRVRDTVVDGSVAARLKGLKELLTSTMR